MLGNLVAFCFNPRHRRHADVSACRSGPISGAPEMPVSRESLRPISGWNARRHFRRAESPVASWSTGLCFCLSEKIIHKNAKLLLTHFQDGCIRALPTAQRRSAASQGRFWSLPLLDRLRWHQERDVVLRDSTFSTRLTVRLRTTETHRKKALFLVRSFGTPLRRQTETKTLHCFRVMASLLSFGDVDDSLRVLLRDREGSAACCGALFRFTLESSPFSSHNRDRG